MVVIGAMLMTSINGLNAGASNLINEQFSTFGANLLTVSSGGGPGFGRPSRNVEIPLNDQTVSTLSRIKYVDEVIPYVQGSVTLKKGRYEKTVSVTGLDQSYFESLAPTAKILDGKYIPETDYMGILLSYTEAYAGEEQVLKTGQTVFLEVSSIVQTSSGQSIETETKSFQIKGILDEIGNMRYDRGIYLSLPAAMELLDKDEYDGIYLLTKDSIYNEDVEGEIEDIYEDSLRVSSPAAIAESINEIMSTFTGFISSIAFISLIVGSVGIVTTLYTSVIERTREVGLLKSLGFNNNMILSTFMIESMMIGAIGGLLGVITGIGGAYVLGNFIAFGPGMRGGSSVSPAFIFSDLFRVWIISFSLSIIAGIYPAWRGSKLNPIEALRKE
jgi:putative ABC transport system permease protein